jgi:hypothetical protein
MNKNMYIHPFRAKDTFICISTYMCTCAYINTLFTHTFEYYHKYGFMSVYTYTDIGRHKYIKNNQTHIYMKIFRYTIIHDFHSYIKMYINECIFVNVICIYLYTHNYISIYI